MSVLSDPITWDYKFTRETFIHSAIGSRTLQTLVSRLTSTNPVLEPRDGDHTALCACSREPTVSGGDRHPRKKGHLVPDLSWLRGTSWRICPLIRVPHGSCVFSMVAFAIHHTN